MGTTQIKNGFNGGSDDQLLVNPDGSINVNGGGTGVPVDVDLTEIGGSPITLGQKTMADSMPVVIASDQSPVDVNLIGLNTFQTSQYTIGITAIQLTVTPLATRSSVSIKAKSVGVNDIVYVGNANTVTTSTGYALFNGDSVQLDLTPSQQIWAISNAAGQKVYVLELGE